MSLPCGHGSGLLWVRWGKGRGGDKKVTSALTVAAEGAGW